MQTSVKKKQLTKALVMQQMQLMQASMMKMKMQLMQMASASAMCRMALHLP